MIRIYKSERERERETERHTERTERQRETVDRETERGSERKLSGQVGKAREGAAVQCCVVGVGPAVVLRKGHCQVFGGLEPPFAVLFSAQHAATVRTVAPNVYSARLN